MRIALVLPGFSAAATDWAIPALHLLAQRLARTDEVIIFSQRYPGPGRYKFAGLTHLALGGGQRFGLASLKIWLQTSQAIIRQHRQTPFDLLHAFWADEAGFSAGLAGRRLNRPVIVSLGGGELSRLAAIDYGAQRFLARRLTTKVALAQASRVTAGSNYQLDLGRKHGLAEAKLAWAPLGVDVEQFRPAAAAPPEPPRLIQAASLLPVKNQTLLLQILALLNQTLPPIRLDLIGSGPGRAQLQRLAEELAVDRQIVWHAQVPYPAMPEHYQQARLYIQTSLHESQGMAVLEAMACGLPVVGTPVGVMKDVASLPAQSDTHGLANQISQILHDLDNYPARSREARQRVVDQFSLPVTTQRFRDLYAEIV
jgi:glycosyltransferase involved in cell wall biosynthesis